MQRYSQDPRSAEVEDLALPRLLCFHGGGSNARIFRNQCRVLSRHLKGKFRLCFVEAPWDSEAGPDVTAVYQDYKPFRRWLRWKPWHPETSVSSATRDIEQCILDAVKEDDRIGGTGQWVGLLGFSQGAKLAASLLLRQQIRAKFLGPDHPGIKTDYRFAVLMAGRGPLVSLDPLLLGTPAIVDVTQIGPTDHVSQPRTNDTRHILRLPTLHVHGLRDQGLVHHRELQKIYCQSGIARLMEWDGDHRVPIKSGDVATLVQKIVEMAREAGIHVEDVAAVSEYPMRLPMRAMESMRSAQAV